MAVSNNAIARLLLSYLEVYPDELDRLRPLLLSAVVGADPLSSPATLPAHVTFAALVARGDGSVLGTRHPRGSRWMLPATHGRPDDSSPLAAVLRALTIVTGVPADAVIPGGLVPVDVDVHVIPAPELGDGESPHLHYELRYALSFPDTVSLPTASGSGPRWFPAAALSTRLDRKARSGSLTAGVDVAAS